MLSYCRKEFTILIIIFLTLFSCTISAQAFDVTITIPPSIQVTNDNLNSSFPIEIIIYNKDGIFNPTTGLKDFAIYFNQYDITEYFLKNITVSACEGQPFEICLKARMDVPDHLLPKGIYFLSAGVRTMEDTISRATATLLIGNPKKVSPSPGNASQLRALIEDNSNKIIYIPAGTYYLTDNLILRLKEGQIIYGDGPDKTILNGANLTVPGLSPILVIGKNTIISSLKVENSRKGSGISLDNSSGFIHNVIATQNGTGGIVASNSQMDVIASDAIANTYDGITAMNSSIANIIMTKAFYNQIDGVGAEKKSNLSVLLSETTSNTGVGIGLFSESVGTIKKSLIRDNGKAGIYIGERSNAETIESNTICQNREDGIAIQHSGTKVIKIYNNIINNNTSGITINDNGKAEKIESNTIKYNVNTNISIINGSSATTINNNILGSKIGIGISGNNTILNSYNDIITQASDLGLLFTNSANGWLYNTQSNYNITGGLSVVSNSYVTANEIKFINNHGFGAGINERGTLILTNSIIQGNSNYGVIIFTSNGSSFSYDKNTLISNNTPSNIGKW